MGFVDELLADGAPPENLGFDDIQFVMVLLSDFLPLVRVGADGFGNDDSLNDDLEVFRETVGLAAALSRGV